LKNLISKQNKKFPWRRKLNSFYQSRFDLILKFCIEKILYSNFNSSTSQLPIFVSKNNRIWIWRNEIERDQINYFTRPIKIFKILEIHIIFFIYFIMVNSLYIFFYNYSFILFYRMKSQLLNFYRQLSFIK
jgi:hypothetical protein